MNKHGIVMLGAGLILILGMFAGCGGRSGEKEYNKAVKAKEKGNLVQARTLFEKATGRLSGNDRKSLAFNELGLVLWKLDEPAAAAEAFNNACMLTDSITDARLNLAIAQFYAGNLDGARVSLNMYLGINPRNKTALAIQSLIAAQKRDWAQAYRIMGQVVAVDPNDPAALNALALAELNHGQSSLQVIDRLKTVVARHPDYAPALYNLGVIHDQWQHDKASAVRYYQDYLAQAGTEGAHAAAAQGAIARLDGQSMDTPSDPAAALQYMKEGARLHGEKKYAQAVAQFQKAIETDPSQEKAYYNMGLASFYLADYTRAQQAFVQALSINPSYADARYMLSYSLVQQKKWDEAEQAAKALATVDPNRGGAMLKHIQNARK